jgi:hypothetical protein
MAMRKPEEVLGEALGERKDLVEPGKLLFDYAQFLLDDDERLTKSGALDGAGRELLRKRALEMLGGPAPREEEEDEDEEEEGDE